MKEITPVAGSTNFSSILCLKISTSLLFDKALSWVVSNVKVSLQVQKLIGKDVTGEMQFTEMSLEIFLLYLAEFDM